MAAPDLEQRARELREKIRFHDHRYDVLDHPLMSDAEYDRLMRELESLEAKAPGAAHPRLAHAACRGALLPAPDRSRRRRPGAAIAAARQDAGPVRALVKLSPRQILRPRTSL